MRSIVRFLAFLAAVVATPARADYVVAPSGGNITGAQVSAALASGDYSLTAASGNLVVNDTVAWSSHTLTLNATAGDINVNTVMTASGTAKLVLNTAATGNVNMDLGGNTFGGRVDFSGNLANRYTVNGKAYTLIDASTNLQALVTANNLGNYALAADNTAGVSLRTNNFYGQFDGLGHVVRNVSISAANSYVGLFGNVSSPAVGVPPGAIRNLGVQGSVAVAGNQFIGGIAGVNDGSIRNSFFTGDVGGGNYVGGIAGVNNGTISNVYVYAGSVGAEGYVGGLVGANNATGRIDKAFATTSWHVAAGSGGGEVGGLVGVNKGSITNAWTTGIASASSGPVGGLVGENTDTGSIVNCFSNTNASGITVGGLAGMNSGVIRYAYATGTIGGGYAGGLVGSNGPGGSISDSYATGSLQAAGSRVGGLVGTNAGSISNTYATGTVFGTDELGGLVGTPGGNVSNSFYAVTDAGGQNINGYDGTTLATGAPWQGNVAGMPKTLAELQTLATFGNPGWNIDDAGGTGRTWRVYDGYTTPLLRARLAPLKFTVDDAVGTFVYDGNVHNGAGTWFATPATYDPSHVRGTGTVVGAVHAGTHPLRLAGLYSDQTGYDLTLVPASITIQPAPLTITPVAGQHKTYGTDDPPAGLAYDTSGIVGNDDAALAGHLGRAAGENVGFYTVGIGNVQAGNTDYEIMLDPAPPAFAIEPALATVAPDSGQSKVLGAADPVYTYTTRGLVHGVAPHYWNSSGTYASAAEIDDTTLSGALGRLPGEAAGDYPYTLATLDAGANYSLALVADAPTFGIYARPTITALSPAFGPMAGGTAVSITGTGFASGVTTVRFGTTAATSVVVNSPTSLVATAPSAILGTVDVTVTTPGGTNATSAAGRYEYRLDVALSASIADRAGYASYGAIVQYDIVIRNAGSQAAASIAVAAALPPQIDAAQALWLCLAADPGSTCTAEGSGALGDNVTLSAQGSVRYLLIALVRDDAAGGAIPMTVSANGPYPYETAGANVATPLVLFRDGFED